jgi:hypothetical protein
MADIEALTDLMTPWCIHTVATLAIADRIAAGTGSVDDLAAATGCDERALHNVMGHLASKGVFRETAPGVFELNDAANALREAGAFLDLTGIGGRFARAWSTIPEYVRTGRAAYAGEFGLPFWEDLAAHPDLAAEFDDLIGPGGHATPPLIEIEGGWDAVRTVVDVGGGTGTNLAVILGAAPNLRGVLVDFPATIERATPILEAAGVADRVELRGQSFFDPLPAGADVYVLRSVLNDWGDEETNAILSRVAEAAGPGARVVVIGGVAPEDEPRRLMIEMVLCGGRTDTLDAFRERTAAVGLDVVAAARQEGGRFVVECRRRA